MLALGVLLARADEECARLPVLAIVVGLEGVGHHLFHSYALDPQNSERVFLAAHAAAPSEVRYLRASTGGARALPSSPLADVFANTSRVLENDPIAQTRTAKVGALRAALAAELARARAVAPAPARLTLLLEACSFPCFERHPYYVPDVAALAHAAEGLAAPRFLVLEVRPRARDASRKRSWERAARTDSRAARACATTSCSATRTMCSRRPCSAAASRRSRSRRTRFAPRGTRWMRCSASSAR